MKLRVLISSCVVLCVSLNVSAAKIDATPGLWEITTKMDPTEFAKVQKGAMDSMERAMADAKSKMTPEQIKMMEKIMAENQPAAKTKPVELKKSLASGEQEDALTQAGNYMATGVMTTKTCLTQQDIDEADVSKDENCEQKTEIISATHVKTISICKATSTRSEMDIMINNPKSFTSKLASSYVMNNQQQTIHGEQTGKWISGDCGKYANDGHMHDSSVGEDNTDQEPASVPQPPKKVKK